MLPPGGLTHKLLVFNGRLRLTPPLPKKNNKKTVMLVFWRIIDVFNFFCFLRFEQRQAILKEELAKSSQRERETALGKIMSLEREQTRQEAEKTKVLVWTRKHTNTCISSGKQITQLPSTAPACECVCVTPNFSSNTKEITVCIACNKKPICEYFQNNDIVVDYVVSGPNKKTVLHCETFFEYKQTILLATWGQWGKWSVFIPYSKKPGNSPVSDCCHSDLHREQTRTKCHCSDTIIRNHQKIKFKKVNKRVRK